MNTVKTYPSKLKLISNAFLIFLFVVNLSSNIVAQIPQLKFQHLTTELGLPDGTVRAITQDKYGYMWLATQYGLCRYNSYGITSYYHSNTDITSIGGNFNWGLFTDSNGDVWVGSEQYLAKYNYAGNDFRNYKPLYNVAISRIAEDEQGMLWLATSGGLMKFDRKTGRFSGYREHADSIIRKIGQTRINDLFLDQMAGKLYLATQSGFRIFDYRKEQILPGLVERKNDLYGINESVISAVTKDLAGNLWIGCGFDKSVLIRWQEKRGVITPYPELTDKKRGWSENRVLSLLTDKNGNVWVGGFTSSLSLLIPESNSFYHYQNDALLNASVGGSSIISLYQDKSGMIWTGMEGYGSDRFHLGNTLFTTYQPEANILPSLLHSWGRTVMEDKGGNIWFGTAKGISVYDTNAKSYRNYFNDEIQPRQISFNTIRSFAEDNDGNIWVGTGNGLNRFDPKTGKFRIYEPGKHLRSYFIWSLLQSSGGDFYVGGTGGLQLYDKTRDIFIEPTEDSLLNNTLRPNVRNLFEDSKGGIWIGFYDGGLSYLDPQKKTAIRYLHKERDNNSLCNNFVTSVKEDQKGMIWIATRDGLSSLDPATQKFKNYSSTDGLPSNKTSGLNVDKSNRIWIATGKGLSVLDPERKFFYSYDMSDGLPTNEFNDQESAKTKNGKLIYPSYRGFITFDPDAVQKRQMNDMPLYAAAVNVFNKRLPLPVTSEELKSLHLKPDQNFFSVELIALNYQNPEKLTYAHKLVPFDKDWVYSKERTVNYTNVGGGEYQLLFKVTTDIAKWDTPVKEIRIYIETVFYKKGWFISIIVLSLLAILYGIYRYRLNQANKLYALKLQATRLEKDKTEIQYQNLINQFNPHFLFNSLTSLNSLIYENKELASAFLEQLSAVYRYLLTHKETQLVTLELETEFIRHYISLLQTRFEKGLIVNIDIDPAFLQKRIVPVTFQLLIENAIKHNMIDQESPLMITFTATESYLLVSNNIQKKGYIDSSNRKGLKSLQTLYKYLSALPLEVEATQEKFVIRVPLI